MSRRCDARHTLSQAAASSINMLLAYLTTPSSIVVAAALIVSFRNHRRNLDTASASVDGHERQVSRTHVFAIVQNVVFHPGLYSHLHRAVKNAIDRRAENYQDLRHAPEPRNPCDRSPRSQHSSGNVDARPWPLQDRSNASGDRRAGRREDWRRSVKQSRPFQIVNRGRGEATLVQDSRSWICARGRPAAAGWILRTRYDCK
jgi:hypothetical protein